jgi:hypothetical protein
MPNSAYYSTAKDAIDSLNTYANIVQKSVPADVAGKAEVDTMNINIKKFVVASREVPITVCPTSCINVGSFYGTCVHPCPVPGGVLGRKQDNLCQSDKQSQAMLTAGVMGTVPVLLT